MLHSEFGLIRFQHSSFTISHSSLVFAGSGVDAPIRQAQSLDRPSIDQMRAHDLLDIRELHEPIPNGLGIHHDGDAVLALVETPRLIDPNRPLQTMPLRGDLKRFTDGGRTLV